MFLERLTLKNYRCFENTEIRFSERMSVIVGDNGSGKTAILEAAAIAAGTLVQPIDEVRSRNIDKRDATIKSFEIGSVPGGEAQFPVEVSASGRPDYERIEWSRSLNSSEGKTTIIDARAMIALGKRMLEGIRSNEKTLILPIVAYYGTGRLWDYHREKRTDVFKNNSRINGYTDSLDGTANLKLMMNWFKKMTMQRYQNQEEGRGGIPEFDTVCRVIEMYYSQVTGYRNVSVRYNLNSNEIDFYYDEDEKHRLRMPLSQMSDGYKGTVSLIADIAYRMSLLNPGLLENTISETPGIVLIDEIDLHLHPAWQERILDDLLKIFPEVQFIVTTHSPIVINSIRSENLILLRNKVPVEAGTEVFGKDANTIIRSIMQTNERPKSVLNQFDEFYSALDEGKINTAREILRDIVNEIGIDDPEVAACEVQLSLEEVGDS